MKITVLTLFDEVYENYLNASIIKKAINNKLVEIEIIDFRQYSKDKHHKVDDYQYGGGAGMVLQMQPIVDAINSCKQPNSTICLTTPSGEKLNQAIVKELSQLEHLILIAGHYEGFDARIEHYIDRSISIGDYVLTGGELATLVLIDAIVRLIPNVINNKSLDSESFDDYLLDYPVYTKPVDYQGHQVPGILLSGNHQQIKAFNEHARVDQTKQKRPDLYKTFLERKKDGKNK